MKWIVIFFALVFSSITLSSESDSRYQQAYEAVNNKEYQQAFSVLDELSKTKHPKAMSLLGYLYANGLGVKKDVNLAADLYRQSADLGDRRGQFNLGDAYQYGRGVEQSWLQAKKWYTEAAQQKYAVAYYRIARIYHFGYGDDKVDMDYAFRFYSQAAVLDHTQSQVLAGALLERAVEHPDEFPYHTQLYPTSKDLYINAMAFYRMAAEKNDAIAINAMGYLYEKGRGVKQDYNKAYQYYLEAAYLGEEYGFSNLAYLYSYGDGVKQDKAYARALYKRSGVHKKGQPLPRFFNGYTLAEIAPADTLPNRNTLGCLLGDETLFGVVLRCGKKSEFIAALSSKGAKLTSDKAADEYSIVTFDVTRFFPNAKYMEFVFDSNNRFINSHYTFSNKASYEKLAIKISKKHGSPVEKQEDASIWQKEDGTQISLITLENGDIQLSTQLTDRLEVLQLKLEQALYLKEKHTDQELDAF
ncbi:tetratricopeptide repeat protein [Motilimonas eburnea]|uniref:tetratricopeptide repeat protein n=1 Tax=Motilimonas eburnea TaxID=1737488 RepID=UPI001E2C0746|nr:tetratricopeptide repeat protein [Motilimonas eburnea]MCE2573776.1 sel1 repeat family protein [Motilimonas eburnea]